MEKMKQTDMVLHHLKTKGSITPLEALHEYGIMRLTSRINDLKKAGYCFEREMVKVKNSSGKTNRYAKYRLKDKEV